MKNLHTILVKLAKEEGYDYGNPDELTLEKVAAVLGVKLVMMNKENKDIINGLKQIDELVGEENA